MRRFCSARPCGGFVAGQPPARRRLGVNLAILLGINILGCSGPKDDLIAVSGKVTSGGQPITKGSVSFRPDASKGNSTLHHPTGDIDAGGNYTLYTAYKPGAPPGWYKVLVFADANPNPRPGVPPQWMHHVKYTGEATTDVTIEVVEKSPAGHYDLNLSR